MSDAPVEMTAVQAIRKYFLPDAKPGEALKEIKDLSPEDKQELAEGACKELGAVLRKSPE